MVARYSFISLVANATCMALMLGSMSYSTSDDKLSLLIILYNILSIAPRTLISVFADRVSNKHDGIRLFTMILFLGFAFPTEFGATTKVVFMAIGSAGIHSFAASSLLSRSEFKAYDIGMFMAGSLLGVGLAEYSKIFGYLAAAFLLMAATPSDSGEGLPEAYTKREEKAPKTALAPIMIVLLLISAMCLGVLRGTVSFDWNRGRKMVLVVSGAAAVGRFIGGYLFDKLSLFAAAASLGGGAALIIACSDSKLFSLVGIVLISMAYPMIASICFRFMPRHSGASFSLVVTFSYFGYLASKIFPKLHENTSALISVSCGIVLLSILTSDILLNIRANKNIKCSQSVPATGTEGTNA